MSDVRTVPSGHAIFGHDVSDFYDESKVSSHHAWGVSGLHTHKLPAFARDPAASFGVTWFASPMLLESEEHWARIAFVTRLEGYRIVLELGSMTSSARMFASREVPYDAVAELDEKSHIAQPAAWWRADANPVTWGNEKIATTYHRNVFFENELYKVTTLEEPRRTDLTIYARWLFTDGAYRPAIGISTKDRSETRVMWSVQTARREIVRTWSSCVVRASKFSFMAALRSELEAREAASVRTRRPMVVPQIPETISSETEVVSARWRIEREDHHWRIRPVSLLLPCRELPKPLDPRAHLPSAPETERALMLPDGLILSCPFAPLTSKHEAWVLGTARLYPTALETVRVECAMPPSLGRFVYDTPEGKRFMRTVRLVLRGRASAFEPVGEALTRRERRELALGAVDQAVLLKLQTVEKEQELTFMLAFDDGGLAHGEVATDTNYRPRISNVVTLQPFLVASVAVESVPESRTLAAWPAPDHSEGWTFHATDGTITVHLPPQSIGEPFFRDAKTDPSLLEPADHRAYITSPATLVLDATHLVESRLVEPYTNLRRVLGAARTEPHGPRLVALTLEPMAGLDATIMGATDTLVSELEGLAGDILILPREPGVLARRTTETHRAALHRAAALLPWTAGQPTKTAPLRDARFTVREEVLKHGCDGLWADVTYAVPPHFRPLLQKSGTGEVFDLALLTFA